MRRFAGKVVLVTGAGSGIGRGIALRFGSEGASVVVVDIDAHSAAKVASEIRRLGSRSVPIVADATRPHTAKKSVSRVLNEFGRLDVLVNNVGYCVVKPLMRSGEKDWDYILDINVKTAFLWSKAAGKEMIERRSGNIINIASDCGKVGDPYSGAYVPAKHAVIGLTKNLALELAPFGIRVNAVCPGWIETKLLDEVNRQMARLMRRTAEQVRHDIVSRIPLGRMGTPEDVAGLVAFLASEDAGYMTGQSINVTGGVTMF